MSSPARIRVVAVSMALGLLAAIAPAFPAAGMPADDPDTPVTAGAGYPGDPDGEARLVASEERRLIDIRSTSESAAAAGVLPSRPYRLTTSPLPTLVLVGRERPYSLAELASLAPRSVQRSGAVYTILENIVVGDGATLRVSEASGLEVRLSSNSTSFVSIITDGGSLLIAGSPESQARVTSWDPTKSAPDLDTTDGRAYIRVFGGRAEFSDTSFENLGFWAGVTGGVALTGAVLPEPWIADGPTDAARAPDDSDALIEPLADESDPEDAGLETLPVDGEAGPGGYASALIQSVRFSGNAFGLFVTNSDRVEIRDSLIEDSLVDGLVFHRDVSNSIVESTTARGNARDGFNLTRATSSVVFSRLTAIDNGRNGITVEGRPLVQGPSATGIPVTAYGNNEVRDSVANHNGRYGIAVIGGTQILVRGNETNGNQIGIVVSGGATNVTVTDNTVDDSLRQGIAVRYSGTDLLVSSNVVSGTEIGIFFRDSGGRIEDNEIREVSNHGIALIGDTGASVVVGNSISGSGPSAIDVARTSGAAVRNNDTSEWKSTKPLDVVLAGIFQPLTILWILIALVLLFSIRRAGARRGIRDPFADQAPLTSLTRGILARESLTESSADRSSEPELVGDRRAA